MERNLLYIISPPVPQGYFLKELLPEHAELIAEEENWSEVADWYTDSTTFKQRVEYFREMIKSFGGVGVYAKDNPSLPIAWTIRKTGMCIVKWQ